MVRIFFTSLLSIFVSLSVASAQYSKVSLDSLPGTDLKECRFRVSFINDVEFEDQHILTETSKIISDPNRDGVTSVRRVAFTLNSLNYTELVQALELSDGFECPAAYRDSFLAQYDRKRKEAEAKGENVVPGFIELQIPEIYPAYPNLKASLLIRSGYDWATVCQVKPSFMTLEKECPAAVVASLDAKIKQTNNLISSGLSAQQNLTMRVYYILSSMIKNMQSVSTVSK